MAFRPTKLRNKSSILVLTFRTFSLCNIYAEALRSIQ